ncbi:MAG: hypothetical protein V1747_07710 [Candidatus Omnitrophota bacterium]
MNENHQTNNKGMSDLEIKSLIVKRNNDAQEIVRSLNSQSIINHLMSSDLATSMSMSIWLGLHDNFNCARGLLVHVRSKESELVSDAYKSSGEIVGRFRCNNCGFETGLGVKYFQQRITKGELSSPIKPEDLFLGAAARKLSQQVIDLRRAQIESLRLKGSDKDVFPSL